MRALFVREVACAGEMAVAVVESLLIRQHAYANDSSRARYAVKPRRRRSRVGQGPAGRYEVGTRRREARRVGWKWEASRTENRLREILRGGRNRQSAFCSVWMKGKVGRAHAVLIQRRDSSLAVLAASRSCQISNTAEAALALLDSGLSADASDRDEREWCW